MIRTIFICCMTLLTTATAMPAGAAALKDLYKVDVPIASQSAADRTDGLQQAMEQVLIRITGSTVVGETAAAQELKQQAAKYVRQFRYIEQEVPLEPVKQAGQAGKAADKMFSLSVTFNGEALERAVIAAGLPVWGNNRPPVLVLVGVQNGSQRLILSADSTDPVKLAIEQMGIERGIPVVFPLMDAQDRRQIDFADLRAGFSEVLNKTAERYNAPMVLEGFLEAHPNGDWSARWGTYRDNTASRWNERYVTLENTVRSGVGGVADILASRYAVSGSSGNTLLDVVLQVEQISAFEHYAQVLNYLDDLIFIEQAIPLRVETNRVIFRLLMRSELSELNRILTLSNMLRPLPLPVDSAVVDGRDRIDLSYSYQAR